MLDFLHSNGEKILNFLQVGQKLQGQNQMYNLNESPCKKLRFKPKNYWSFLGFSISQQHQMHYNFSLILKKFKKFCAVKFQVMLRFSAKFEGYLMFV